MYILHAPISGTKSGTSARVELPANIVAVSKLQAASEFAALEQLGGTLAQIALGDVGVTVQLAVRRQGTKPVQIDFKPIGTFNFRAIGAGALQREGPVGLQSLGAPSLRPAAAAAASGQSLPASCGRRPAALQLEGPLGPQPVETPASRE